MELKALRRLGWRITDLAREFGLSRTTVYKELASPGPRTYGPRERPAALNEAQLVHVERRLTVCPGIRGTDLHAAGIRESRRTCVLPSFVEKSMCTGGGRRVEHQDEGPLQRQAQADT